MKSILQTFSIAALLASSAWLASGNVLGAESKQETAGTAKAGVSQPVNVAAALDLVRKLHAELATVVKARRLADVHHASETLLTAVGALGAFTKDLPAEKQPRVDGALKNLARALDTLHDAADNQDQAASDRALTTVDGLITLINAQYPPSTPAKK